MQAQLFVFFFTFGAQTAIFDQSPNFGSNHPRPGRDIPTPQVLVGTVQIPSQGKEGSLSPDLFGATIFC